MGGAEKVAALHARELNRRGHDVSLIAYHPGNQVTALLAGSSVEVVHVSAHPKERFVELRRLFRNKQFDVVHAYKVRSAIWGKCASVGLRPSAWFIGQHYLDSDPWKLRILAHLFHGQRIAWIVPSNAAATVVRRSYGADSSSIFLVPNPVDLSAFVRTRPADLAKKALGLQPDAPVVSIVANLHAWKNHGLFLRAARKVLQIRPDAVFLVIGKDQSNGAVQQHCATLGLDHAVWFLGYREDVPRLLEATDLLVVTSAEESFCLALAEAGAMSVPAVSTDNGGAREVLLNGQTGLIVPGDDEQALAAEILRLLNDNALSLAMGSAARNRVRELFSLETTVDLLEAIYLRTASA